MGKGLIRAGLAGAVVLGGCNVETSETEYSGPMTERAVVKETIYTPSRHGSGTSPNLGLDGDGNMTLGLEFTDITIPEKWAVVFRCDHGDKFIIQGTTARYEALWKKFDEDDVVEISFREVYKSRWKDLDGDGKRDLVSRTLVDYDFLDAVPIRAEN